MSHAARCRAALLLAPLLLPAAGCAAIDWRSARIDLPPDLDAAQCLEVGTSTLTECLELLGAPNEVLEAETDEGWVLTWAWTRSRGWGASVSLPISDSFNASLNWQDDSTGAHRLQLRFAADGTLSELAFDPR
jgi:hypothetical protein